MKTVLSVLLILISLGNTSFPSDRYVDERTSTEVYFSVQEKMFPQNWYSKKINAMAVPLEEGERERMIGILDRAFSKYPNHVLKENLDRVYAVKSLTFYDVPYGGTNSRNTIYLADNSSSPAFTDHFIEGVFHHEFSSILMRTCVTFFNEKEWKKVNPAGFLYGNGGVNAILNGEASLTFDPALFTQGFLNKYSQSALEEDINVFAQNLFTSGSAFWSVVDENPRVRKKAELLIAFYHRIDPAFTEDYFRYPGSRLTNR
jgi:hypothetical protein